jgi:quercetin 2,3-dioxygenase
MSPASSAVQQVFALGTHWPTIDPFLFCAHHLDHYPQGDATMRPKASLAGRDIGSDFAGIDGWNMYHGSEVPGFPQHPHRGFETITYVRRGVVDHSDSLGATARFGAGDSQWLTAGSGIVHSEMFPMIHDDRPNTLELFQLWLNLPAANKLVDPYFTMCWAERQHRCAIADGDGEVIVVAGSYPTATSTVATPVPPDSWAADPAAGVAVWHVRLAAGAMWHVPAAEVAGVARVMYVFEGGPITIGDTVVPTAHGAVVATDAVVIVQAAGDADIMVLQGRPIGEPVAQYGPFVMNTRAQIQQAFEDFQRTSFGGWPHAGDGPVHGDEPRFAVHPDGRRDAPPSP